MKYAVEHFEGPQARVVSRVTCRNLFAALARFNDLAAKHIADREAAILLVASIDHHAGTVLASKSRKEVNRVEFNARFFSDWAFETNLENEGGA